MNAFGGRGTLRVAFFVVVFVPFWLQGEAGTGESAAGAVDVVDGIGPVGVTVIELLLALIVNSNSALVAALQAISPEPDRGRLRT